VTPALLDTGVRLVIGHRGAAARAPENTLPSFDLALAAGVDALEFDVHLSADGRVVVIHDEMLGRTTDGSGAVAALTLAQIQALDAGARFTRDGRTFPYRGAGVRIPTIEEVLARFPGTPLLIELKTAAASAELRRVLAAHHAEDRCVIGAFDHAALEPFRAGPWHLTASQPEALRMLGHVIFGLPAGERRYEALSIPPTWHRIPLPLRAIARDARQRGVPVHVWTVDNAAEALQHWEHGVSGIITNDPAPIIEARRGAR
jgi:glycerophosphoryl diester phosphodiesterase